MIHRFRYALCLYLVLLAGCAAPPAATQPPPSPTTVVKKVVVTQVILQSTPTASIITATPLPTGAPIPVTPTRDLPHEWVDYGGICMRPDNLPLGVQISPDPEVVKTTRQQLLSGLWYLMDASGSRERVVPNFSSESGFVLGTLSGAKVSGPVLPLGKSSTQWFRLADPVSLWEDAHPGEKIQGIALDMLCLEFFDPLEFRHQQTAAPGMRSVRITLPESGELTSVIFAVEEVLGAPRLVLKLMRNPYGERNIYPEFQGFLAGNTPVENTQATNDHLGVVHACLTRVDWSNHDEDNQLEFGYNWRLHRKPMKFEVFKTIHLFVQAP